MTLYSPDDGIALGTVARVNIKDGQMKGVNEKELVSRGLTSLDTNNNNRSDD